MSLNPSAVAAANVAASQRRINVRERPISIMKKLKVVHGNDVESPELLAELLKLTQLRNEELAADAARIRALAASIPTPDIRQVPNHSTFIETYGQFKQPEHYIKCSITTLSGITTDYEFYDVLQEDIEFIQTLPEADRPTETALGDVIGLLEKAAYQHSQNIDCSEEVPLSMASQLVQDEKIPVTSNALEKLYKYWIKKRMQFNNALIRMYQTPPPAEDKSPYTAFRPRAQPKRVSHRNPRKNDGVAYDKLRLLRRDFDRVQDLLRLVADRESMKKDYFLLSTHLFDQELQDTLFGKKYSASKKAAAKATPKPEPATPSRSLGIAPPVMKVEETKGGDTWDSFIRTKLPFPTFEIQKRLKKSGKRKAARKPATHARPRDKRLKLKDASDDEAESDGDIQFFEELEAYVKGRHPHAKPYNPQEELQRSPPHIPMLADGKRPRGFFQLRQARCGRTVVDILNIENQVTPSSVEDDIAIEDMLTGNTEGYKWGSMLSRRAVKQPPKAPFPFIID